MKHFFAYYKLKRWRNSLPTRRWIDERILV